MAVAPRLGMHGGTRLDALAMTCPSCGQPQVPAMTGSTLTIAWYACACGHFWSARVRDGRPIVAVPPPALPPPSPMH